MFLLDTNICIGFLNGRLPGVDERLAAETATDVVLCSVVKAELLFGAYESERRGQNLKRLEQFFAAFSSLPFTDEAADWYGRLRAILAKAGEPIGNNDLLIAATALSANVTLVTRNEKEFRKVPGLRLEVW